MPIPVRRIDATDDPAYNLMVTDDGSRTLIEVASGDSFHSGCGAVAETRHVYLRNSGAAERLTYGHPTSVLEVGVGTAMGLLMTLSRAMRCDANLSYVGLESDWISAKVLEQLEPHRWIRDTTIIERFLAWRRRLPVRPDPGEYGFDLDSKRRVIVIVGDAMQWQPAATTKFHAIYFDPFAPASSPELWQAPMLAKMHSVLHPCGRLATYCVNRQVRDTLSSVGFVVHRTRGPAGGKREVLIAKIK